MIWKSLQVETQGAALPCHGRSLYHWPGEFHVSISCFKEIEHRYLKNGHNLKGVTKIPKSIKLSICELFPGWILKCDLYKRSNASLTNLKKSHQPQELNPRPSWETTGTKWILMESVTGSQVLSNIGKRCRILAFVQMKERAHKNPGIQWSKLTTKLPSFEDKDRDQMVKKILGSEFPTPTGSASLSTWRIIPGRTDTWLITMVIVFVPFQ